MSKNLSLVFKIWRLSLMFLSANFRRLGQFVLLPMVVLSLLGVAANYMAGLFFLAVFAQLALYVMFCVAWHNYILAPDADKTVWQYLKWNQSKWQYLGLFLLLSFSFVIVVSLTGRPTLWFIHSINQLAVLFSEPPPLADFPAPVVGFGDVISLIAIAGISLPLSRLMFLLPSVAIGEQINLKRIWAVSEEVVLFCFLLFLSLLASQIIFGYAGVILRYIIVGVGFDERGLSLTLINELIWHGFNYITIAMSVTPLSFAYGFLTEK